jgi:hypothetical protein
VLLAAPRRLQVPLSTANDAISDLVTAQSTMGEWDDLGGAFNAGPSVASWSANRLDPVVRGADDQLWQKAWNGGWTGYYPLGGLLTSSPAVASWAPRDDHS